MKMEPKGPAGVLVALGLALSLAAEAQPGATLPARYVGAWTGVSGAGSAKTTARVRTANVTKSFGHEIKQFEFKVADDGAVTGAGTATYWFDVTSDADLLVFRRKDEATWWVRSRPWTSRFRDG